MFVCRSMWNMCVNSITKLKRIKMNIFVGLFLSHFCLKYGDGLANYLLGFCFLIWKGKRNISRTQIVLKWKKEGKKKKKKEMKSLLLAKLLWGINKKKKQMKKLVFNRKIREVLKPKSMNWKRV